MISDCIIIKELTPGGQKTVFLAEHPNIGLVVIKRGAFKSFTSLERIKREVGLLAEINSVYYPKQHYFNVNQELKEFEIVEEYIEGKELRNSMGEFKTPLQIMSLMDKMALGLSMIWEKNIVHRDLKPENIIIRPDSSPCIIDLGIARFLDLESLTITIAPSGPCTPSYAAPEQLANKKNLIDSRTDFYNMGIIALELYLGEHPFKHNLLGGGFSIAENIMKNIYLLENSKVLKDDIIEAFANRTLQLQPYNRFRNHQAMRTFTSKHLQP